MASGGLTYISNDDLAAAGGVNEVHEQAACNGSDAAAQHGAPDRVMTVTATAAAAAALLPPSRCCLPSQPGPSSS